MSKIILLAFTFCTIPVALGSLSLSKSQVQALSLDDTVTIETIDNIPFEVEIRYAQLSQTLSNLIKEVGIENSLSLECSSYTWSLIQCLLPKVLKVNHDIEAQEAQEEIIEMIQSLDAQNLLHFVYAVIYLDIPLLQKLSVDEMALEENILAIPAELIASIPGDIRNPIITRHLINTFGALPVQPLAVCKEAYRSTYRSIAPLLLTPDGKIVSVDSNNAFCIWDSTTGQQLAVCEGSHFVYKKPWGSDDGRGPEALWVTPDSNIVSFSRKFDKILIWDSATGKQLAELGHITAVCITPDGRIISGALDGSICIWSTTGQQLAVCKGHTHPPVTEVRVLPDGKIVSASRYPGTIFIWNSTLDQQLAVCDHADGIGEPEDLYITPDGKIVSVTSDDTFRIWDSTTGKRLARRKLLSSMELKRISVVHQGKIIGVVLDTESGDGQIRTWDSTTGQLLAFTRHYGKVMAFCVLPDGKIASASAMVTIIGEREKKGTFCRGLSIWDSTTGQLTTCTWWQTLATGDLVLDLVALPDGKIVSASRDKTVRIFDSRTGQQLAVCYGHNGYVRSLTITPYGKIVSGSEDGTLCIWDSSLTLPMNPHQVKKVWVYLQQLIKLRNNGTSLMNIFNKAFWHRIGDKLTSTAAYWEEIERILSEED